MRIIGLYGHANCGKSATLNYLKELLRSAGKSISFQPHPNNERPETFKYKGLIVCVAPAGDDENAVNNNVRYFKSKNCDVAISATRTKWGSVKALEDFATREGVCIEWVQKSYEHQLSKATQNTCNQETAQIIFDRI